MEHYLLLRIVHGAAAVLLLLGVLAHGVMLYRAWRSGDAARLQGKLQRTRRYSLPLLSLLGLSLPLSGWWLVDIAGWPLGLTWLLASSLLFVLLAVVGLLLAGRLRLWASLGEVAASPSLLGWSAAYGIALVVLLLAIMALMGAKPA